MVDRRFYDLMMAGRQSGKTRAVFQEYVRRVVAYRRLTSNLLELIPFLPEAEAENILVLLAGLIVSNSGEEETTKAIQGYLEQLQDRNMIEWREQYYGAFVIKVSPDDQHHT